MTFNFNTTEYRWSHGREPRGTGTWAFEVAPKIGKPAERFWSYGTYTAAKKAVAQYARERGCYPEIKVLP